MNTNVHIKDNSIELTDKTNIHTRLMHPGDVFMLSRKDRLTSISIYVIFYYNKMCTMIYTDGIVLDLLSKSLCTIHVSLKAPGTDGAGNISMALAKRVILFPSASRQSSVAC
jgi:hypothetical protein